MLTLDGIAFDGLAPVSLVLDAGECLGISGSSGSGKTRLLRVIADLDEHQGSALLDGSPCESMPAPDWRRQVGLLPAESLWWFDRVAEHFPEKQSDLSALGFDDSILQQSVSRCSSGEKQRLAILRCLANQPRVVLLDEPTANLDADNTARVEALIQDYLDSTQACCIWVSHNHEQLQRMSNRQMVLIDGELREGFSA